MLLASTAGISLPGRAQAQTADASAARDYNIPAKALGEALADFGQQSGLQVSVDATQVDGLRSPGVSGRLSAARALDRLLGGTGLAWRRNGDLVTLARTIQTAGVSDQQQTIVTEALRVEGTAGAQPTGVERDARGYDDIYDRDTTTTYMGKEEVERYKGVTASDVLKGMLGVFSGDPRNGGAIDPSVRGISGPGRVPVIIDGTEQALTVWRGYNGASNRAYIDPSLISGIQVQKGPVSARGIDGSIGGAVVVHTLDADDILRKGQNFGIEARLEGGDNSTAPRWPTLLTGQDYRTVPNFLGPAGSFTGPSYPYNDPALRVTPRTSDDNHLFSLGDKAARVAVAGRLGDIDLFGAYAYRTRGNYFSGENGADYYSRSDLVGTGAGNFVRYMALKYLPGNEVTNTSSDTSSWLAKAVWHINAVSDLKAGFRDTLAHYGDILSSRLISGGADLGSIQWPESRVRTQAYNLDYRLQPNKWWLDLKASFWATHTLSATNSLGGFPDAASGPTDPIIINTAVAHYRNDRFGLIASNQFKLGSRLDLLMEGNWQREVLRSQDPLNTSAACSFCQYPRSGRREEYRIDFKSEWRPTSFLKLNAGVTYSGFSATDDLLRGLIASGQAPQNSAITGYKTNINYDVTDKDSYYYWALQRYLGLGLSQTDAEQRATTAANSYTPSRNGTFQLQGVDTFDVGDDGRFTRAENPCLNGAYSSISGYEAGSCTLTPVIQFFSPTYADTHSSGHDWAPMASATLYLSGASRIYARYAEAYRYPSIFESTLGFSASYNPLAKLKPEHMHSVEAAFIQDLRPLFHLSGDQKADFKLTWYRNVTTNVIERDTHLLFFNIDKQIISGLEVQARYDNGRIFADLGYAHVFTNKACDESTASTIDLSYNALARIPNCVKYGFYGGYLLTQAAPDDTANATIGARFLKRRLESGMRFTWFSAYKNPLLDTLVSSSQPISGYGLNVPYAWGSTLTVDAYARFRVNDRFTVELDGTNLTDRYYGDPLTRSLNPAPGRTVRLSLTARL